MNFNANSTIKMNDIADPQLAPLAVFRLGFVVDKDATFFDCPFGITASRSVARRLQKLHEVDVLRPKLENLCGHRSAGNRAGSASRMMS